MRPAQIILFSALLACCAAFAAPGPASGGSPAPAPGLSAAATDTQPSWSHFLGLGDFLLSFARDVAGAAYDQQDFRTAAAYFDLLHHVDPNDREITKRLGYAFKESGRYEEAHDLLFQCTVDDPNDYMTWWWLSDTQRLLGDYKKAYESMVASRDVAPENERQGLQTYVDYTEALGTIVPSWSNFEKHREFAKRHEKMRRFRRTIAEYLTALDTIPPAGPEDNDTPLRKAWVFNQIGIQYNQLKQPEVALDYFHRAARSYADAHSAADVMMATQNLAVTYRALATTNPARRVEFLELGAKHWADALKMAREINDIPYIRYAQAGELLCLVAARGTEDPAVKEAREANLKELPWRGPVNEYTTGCVAIAELACRTAEGDYAGARIVAEMALPFFTASGFLLDLEEAIDIYLQLANALTHQGHYDEALKQTTLAETRVLELRQYMDADSFARSINTFALRGIAAARIRANIHKDDFDAARGAADAFHIQALADLLGNKIEDDASRNDFETELELLKRGLAMLDQDLAAAQAASDTAEAARIAARIEEDKNRAAWLENGVRFNAREAVSYTDVPLLGALELGPTWPADTQILSIVADSFGAVAVLFDGASAWGGELPGTPEETLQPLSEKIAAGLNTQDAATGDALKAIADLLIAPIADHLAAKTIYIATDGPLAAIPFELLPLNGSPLLASHDIAYIPSASHITRLLARPKITGAPIRIAGNAPPAIAAALPGAIPCATELCTAQPIDAATTMVICAPLDLTAPDPTLAAITLAPEGLYDGTLYAAELLGAHVNTNTVWLAPQNLPNAALIAPWTALEEGFLQAGAAAVVRPAAPIDETALASLLKAALTEKGLTLASLSAAKRALLAASPENTTQTTLRITGVAN